MSLAKNLSDICKALKKKAAKWDWILPLLGSLTRDKDSGVKVASINQLLVFSETCTSHEKESYLLGLVIGIARAKEVQVYGVHLLSKFAKHLKPQTCEKIVLPEIINSTQSYILKVKKKAIRALPKVSKSIHWKAFNKKVLPVFVKLCSAENSIVKKECSDVIGKLAHFASSKERKTRLLEVFIGLLQNSSNFVREASQKQVGRFLSELGYLDCFLLKEYKQAAMQNKEPAVMCAYYFPEVLRTTKNWSELLQVFQSLAANPQSQVRIIIAAAFPLILKNLADKDVRIVVSIYKHFLRDVDEVKIKALKGLPLILQKIDRTKRMEFLDIVRRIQKFNLNWRIRNTVAKKLAKIARNYNLSVWAEHLWEVGLGLAYDDFAAVRTSVCGSLGFMFKSLWNIRSDWNSQLLQSVSQLAQSQSYQDRITFLKFAKSLTGSIDNFSEIKTLIQELCTDTVVNVRICCSELVKEGLGKNTFWSTLASILNSDCDWDVVLTLKGASLSTAKNKHIQVEGPIMLTWKPKGKTVLKNQLVGGEQIQFLMS